MKFDEAIAEATTQAEMELADVHVILESLGDPETEEGQLTFAITSLPGQHDVTIAIVAPSGVVTYPAQA